MSNFTNFSLSVEKGLRGNIGKMTVLEKKDGTPFMDVMLFLVPNGKNEHAQSQVVNVHFPEDALLELKNFNVSDYVRVYFDRIDLAKGINKQSGKEALYITVKASGINMLKKSEKKAESKPASKARGKRS